MEGPRTPHHALDLQVAMIPWWRTHGRRLGDTFDVLASSEKVEVAPMEADLVLEALGGWTLWVGPDVVLLLEYAQAEIPPPDGGCLGAGILPAPSGVAWFGGEIPLVTSEAYPILGLIWAVGTDTFEGTRYPVVRVWPVIPGARVGAEVSGPGDTVIIPPIRIPLSAEAAVMTDGWDAIGVSEWGAQEWRCDDVAVQRWALAMWVLCGQHLPRHTVHADRAQRRRFDRTRAPKRPDWGEVHVTTLRRRSSGKSHASDEGVVWTHQWVVSGHWRWQACGKNRSERKLIWISPYIKGPESMPLVEVEQVAKLIR